VAVDPEAQHDQVQASVSDPGLVAVARTVEVDGVDVRAAEPAVGHADTVEQAAPQHGRAAAGVVSRQPAILVEQEDGRIGHQQRGEAVVHGLDRGAGRQGDPRSGARAPSHPSNDAATVAAHDATGSTWRRTVRCRSSSVRTDCTVIPHRSAPFDMHRCIVGNG